MSRPRLMTQDEFLDLGLTESYLAQRCYNGIIVSTNYGGVKVIATLIDNHKIPQLNTEK
ncbi:MAG: hypothetical protein NTW17_01835 [Candidatus Pacearchaeota archaeon]|nr:hypothetical protein [Candidatus Pacearchaeota archaeon]